jgi:hypothetical protein
VNTRTVRIASRPLRGLSIIGDRLPIGTVVSGSGVLVFFCPVDIEDCLSTVTRFPCLHLFSVFLIKVKVKVTVEKAMKTQSESSSTLSFTCFSFNPVPLMCL